MKKLIAFLLLACMMLTALASCGKTTNDPTPSETTPPTTNKKFEAEMIPAEKFKPRDVVVAYMEKMSQVKWTPKETINLNEVNNGLVYKKGVEYTGIMYITGTNSQSNLDKFLSQLDENGVYVGPITRAQGYGNHCSSSIRTAYNQISNVPTFATTVQMVPSQNRGTLPVGDYVFSTDDVTTDTIIAKNPAEKIYECYALLQKGDNVLSCWGSTGHTRMVKEVHVVRTADGKLDTKSSYIITIEQTSSFDSTRKDVKTNWYVDHKYSFRDLYNTKYIPLTIAALSVEGQDSTFTIKSANTASNITEGKLKGIIRSSFCDIISVTVDFVDSSDKVVATKTMQNLVPDRTVFQFLNNDAIAPEGVTTLPAGDYRYYVTVNTHYGSAKIFELKFTVQ